MHAGRGRRRPETKPYCQDQPDRGTRSERERERERRGEERRGGDDLRT